MNVLNLLKALKKFGKRASSLLMLFQRTPAAQVLLPAEFNLASSSALMDASRLLITTVAGLGAYDSVAGATTLTQVSGSLNGTTGQPFSATFQVSGSPSTPKSWRIINGPMQAGISLPNTVGSTNAISGTPTESGSKTVTIEAWEKSGFSGGVVRKSITINISDPSSASIVTHPAGTTVDIGQTATLSVTASGATPITYQWYQGVSGDTSKPVGTNSASFTTPALTAATKYWVRVSNAQNITGANSNTATVLVRLIKPVLDPVTFPTITVGETFLHRLSAQNYPKTFSVTGLPKGLKLNPASGEITGIPDVSGLFILQIRASNSAGSSLVLKAPLTIRALPKHLVGSFGGTLQRLPAVNQNLGGMFSLSVTSNGFYSLKLTSALASVTKSNASSSFSSTGRLAPSPPHISISLAGQPLSLSINPASGAVSGSLGAATLSGWRAAWNATTNPAENLVGYYSFAIDLSDPNDDGKDGIPQGSGFATFSVSNSGAISIVGKSADGEPLTSSPLLGANGEFWLYSPLYKNLGTLQGSLTLTEDPAGLFSGNSIAGLLSWSKPTTTSRAYPAFGPIVLSAQGAYLAPASKGNPALGLPDTGTVGLRFTDGGLADSDPNTDPDVDFTFTDEDKVQLSKDPLVNKGQVTLTLNPASGAISGTFTLVETTPVPFTRAKVPFQAQVVRLANGRVKAAGFFLLPQIPSGDQKPADTPILSGRVQLIQPVP
jgi:hypothetical protein